jgi:hypothetical protein
MMMSLAFESRFVKRTNSTVSPKIAHHLDNPSTWFAYLTSKRERRGRILMTFLAGTERNIRIGPTCFYLQFAILSSLN